MLRQITESVVISKIREDDLMNSKSEWNYVRILRTVVNQLIASLLLRVIFHALLRRVSVILNTLCRSIEEVVRRN